MLRYAYNTNGFAHHRLEDAIDVIREIGYNGIGLTLDVHHLDPFRTRRAELRAWRERLAGLEVVVHTGARFILDPRRKHQPTLLSADPGERARRREFLERAVEIAGELEASAVSFWSGAPAEPAGDADRLAWLAENCRAICDKAARAGVSVAFEPEPGMWVETLDQYAALRNRVQHQQFGLALDVGHLFVTGEVAAPGALTPTLQKFAGEIRVMQIEDIAGGVHEHRMFGEGEINFSEVLGAVMKINYRGLLECELSRDSHRAPVAAREALRFLQTSEHEASRMKKDT